MPPFAGDKNAKNPQRKNNMDISLIYPPLRWQCKEILMAGWPEAARLHPEDAWFCLGSCFAQRSAKALKQHLLSVHLGARAPLYTPEAIFRWLQLCQTTENGQKHFFDAVSPLFIEAPDSHNHGRGNRQRFLHPHTPGWLEAEKSEELGQLLWRQCHFESQFLQRSRVVLITLGSSFSLYSAAQQCYWSNGHRLNARANHLSANNTSNADTQILQKELFRPQQIEQALEGIIHIIYVLNPRAQIICSVSPLRHDPLPPEENSLSKAQLLCAVHRLRRRAAHETGPFANWSYFPAYEIVMDELRDYRWYERKQLRIESLTLLLKRLLAAVASKQLKEFLHQTTNLGKLLRHKQHDKDSKAELWPGKPNGLSKKNPDSQPFQKQNEEFAKSLLEQLKGQYPQAELPKDIESYRNLLAAYRLEEYTY